MTDWARPPDPPKTEKPSQAKALLVLLLILAAGIPLARYLGRDGPTIGASPGSTEATGPAYEAFCTELAMHGDARLVGRRVRVRVYSIEADHSSFRSFAWSCADTAPQVGIAESTDEAWPDAQWVTLEATVAPRTSRGFVLLRFARHATGHVAEDGAPDAGAERPAARRARGSGRDAAR